MIWVYSVLFGFRTKSNKMERFSSIVFDNGTYKKLRGSQRKPGARCLVPCLESEGREELARVFCIVPPSSRLSRFPTMRALQFLKRLLHRVPTQSNSINVSSIVFDWNFVRLCSIRYAVIKFFSSPEQKLEQK